MTSPRSLALIVGVAALWGLPVTAHAQWQGGYAPGGRFACESNDGRYVECAANTRAGIQLVRQLSRAPCIEGRSWGYGRAGIWVAQGCRAEFRSF